MNKSTLSKLKSQMQENLLIDDNPFSIRFEDDKPHYYYNDSIDDEYYEINYKEFKELQKEYHKFNIANPWIEIGF